GGGWPEVWNQAKRPAGSLPPSKAPAGPAPPRRPVCAPAAMFISVYRKEQSHGSNQSVHKAYEAGAADAAKVTVAADRGASGRPDLAVQTSGTVESYQSWLAP